jgi:hypothetical protein
MNSRPFRNQDGIFNRADQLRREPGWLGRSPKLAAF